MFEAYFDESGDPAHPDNEIFSLAWVVAPSNAWKKFSLAWNRILRRHKIDVMHMRDYEHCLRQFKGWSKPQKEAFAAQLAGILKPHFKMGQCHSMSSEVWRKQVSPEMVTNFRKKRGPYVFLLQSCLEELADYAKTLPKGERIACIFDENSLVAGAKPLCLGAAVEHYSALKEARGWDFFAGATFESKKEFVPLQAADMLAYEGYKDMVNLFDGKPRDRRKLLSNLMGSGRVQLAFCDVNGFWKETKENRNSP